MSRRVLLLPSVLAALALPAAAEGAVRHAAPAAGATAACSAADPCAVQTAIEDADPGDEVVLAPGTYAALPEIVNASIGVHVHGAADQPAPTLVLAPPNLTYGIQLAGGLASVEHLRLVMQGNAAAIRLGTGSTVQDVTVTSEVPDADGIAIGGAGTLRSHVRDVFVRVPGTGVETSGNADVDESTLLGALGLFEFNSSGPRSISVRNSILQGTNHDVDIMSTTSTDVDLDYTRVADVHRSSVTTTFTLGSHVVAAPATFTDDAGHQAADSPGIDAGLAGPLTAPADSEGTRRPLGGGLDLGAYEYRTSQLVSTTGASDVTHDAAQLHGTIDPQGQQLDWEFVYGPTTGYGTSAGPHSVAAGSPPLTVSSLAGQLGARPPLLPSTTYHYRLQTVNEYGEEVRGADATFTTAPAPAPGGPVDPGPGSVPQGPGTGTPGQGGPPQAPPTPGDPGTPKGTPKTPKAACRVPTLRGRTLAQARKRLRTAHCTLGRVRGRHGRRLVVRTQTVRAGTRRPGGTRVGVTLAPRPRKR